MKKSKAAPNKGLTPGKQKRRPGGGDPSPVKPFKLSPGTVSYRKQGR